MKIAIHHRKGSFSDRWIDYCKETQIPYKIVNCYDSDIISQLSDCDGLMWHWTLSDCKATLFAHQLINSLEKIGIKVYPNINTSWHYDDKVGQMYLLEALKAPLVKSYIFYSKKEAFNWIENTAFPKVFKLRRGAGSTNVSLVKSKRKAKNLANRSFRKGFSPINCVGRLKDKIWVLKRDKCFAAFKNVIKGTLNIIFPSEVKRLCNNDKGYIYFQDFIPENKYDTRLFVVGNRCFGFRRFCRDGDFRASGSGLWDPNPIHINKESVSIALKLSKKIGAQSIAFDFILDGPNPKIIEISYCFPKGAPDCCPGYWDENLDWHPTKINAEEFIIQDFLKTTNTTHRKFKSRIQSPEYELA